MCVGAGFAGQGSEHTGRALLLEPSVEHSGLCPHPGVPASRCGDTLGAQACPGGLAGAAELHQVGIRASDFYLFTVIKE